MSYEVKKYEGPQPEIRGRDLGAYVVGGLAVALAAVSLSGSRADQKTYPSYAIPPAIKLEHGHTKLLSSPYYFYVGGYEDAESEGASVELSQGQPLVGPADNHSVMELAVESSATDQKDEDIIEVGWIVTKDKGHDPPPRLFSTYWVDGQPTCFEGCGFVQVSHDTAPGDVVKVGVSAEYGIRYEAGNWEVTYDNREVGYYPGRLWGGQFTQSDLVQVYGEVASKTNEPCSQMGNGKYGTSTGSAQIAKFNLIDSASAPSLNLYAFTPSVYDYGSTTPTGMNLGGPGNCDYGERLNSTRGG
jgi:hypothetical protein